MITMISLDQFRDAYQDKSVLVVGGLGAIGSYMAWVLAELGSHVTLLDTNTAAGRASLVNIVPGLREQFTIVEGSIADEVLMRSLIVEGRFQMVLNFAAHASFIEAATLNPLETFRSNAFGVAVLTDALREHGRDLEWAFHASTDKVYGDSHGERYDEDATPLWGRGLYDVSKMVADIIFNTYHRVFDVPTITLRLCNLYGPYEFGRTADYRVVPKTLKMLFEPPTPAPPELYLDSLVHSRDYLYIDDFVRAVLLLGQNRSCIGEVFNLQGYHALTPEIIALTSNAALEVADRHDPARAKCIRANGLRIPLGDRPSHLVTIVHQSAAGEKLARATGFQPEIPLQEGLLRTAEFYFQHYRDHPRRVSTRGTALANDETRRPICVK